MLETAVGHDVAGLARPRSSATASSRSSLTMSMRCIWRRSLPFVSDRAARGRCCCSGSSILRRITHGPSARWRCAGGEGRAGGRSRGVPARCRAAAAGCRAACPARCRTVYARPLCRGRSGPPQGPAVHAGFAAGSAQSGHCAGRAGAAGGCRGFRRTCPTALRIRRNATHGAAHLRRIRRSRSAWSGPEIPVTRATGGLPNGSAVRRSVEASALLLLRPTLRHCRARRQRASRRVRRCGS